MEKLKIMPSLRKSEDQCQFLWLFDWQLVHKKFQRSFSLKSGSSYGQGDLKDMEGETRDIDEKGGQGNAVL